MFTGVLKVVTPFPVEIDPRADLTHALLSSRQRVSGAWLLSSRQRVSGAWLLSSRQRVSGAWLLSSRQAVSDA